MDNSKTTEVKKKLLGEFVQAPRVMLQLICFPTHVVLNDYLTQLSMKIQVIPLMYSIQYGPITTDFDKQIWITNLRISGGGRVYATLIIYQYHFPSK